MYADQFEVRLAKVRHRFATALESKITNTLVLADRMARGEDGSSKLVSDAYRHLHTICGIGPTVGFTATGEAARVAESALMRAMFEKRKPSENEIMSLKKALAHLRTAAASELRLMYQRGG
jgi:chemotaxis protein histidine kinase CheA